MPTTLNQYTLGRTLGSGVSCKVKLAKDEAGTRYAIKIIHSDQSFDELIDTEVQALAQLQHQNIVRLVEVNTGEQINPKKGSKEVKFIALELVGGGELFDFVALGGRLTEPQARYFFRQMLDGLGFMHQRGFAHRDLKPENILLDSNFVIKITDFGFAAPLCGRDGSGVLHTQLGTASYMAPEIHLGKEYDGAKVDLFAAAIILFVILTQRPPFSSANPKDPHYRLIAAGRANVFWQAHAEAENGEDIYSPEFKDFFEKMMALKPSNRLTIEQILAHPFMQGPEPTSEEINEDFMVRKGLVDFQAHSEREAKRLKRLQAGNTHSNQHCYRGADNANFEDGDTVENPREAWQSLEVEEYGPCYVHNFTQFFTTSKPLDYFSALVDFMNSKEIEYCISSSKLRLKFETVIAAEEDNEEKRVRVEIQVLQLNEQNKSCVQFSYKDATSNRALDMQGQRDILKHFMSVRGAPELSMHCDTTFEAQI